MIGRYVLDMWSVLFVMWTMWVISNIVDYVGGMF